MLLMVEEGIRGGMCQIINTCKIMMKKKNIYFCNIYMQTTCMDEVWNKMYL